MISTSKIKYIIYKSITNTDVYLIEHTKEEWNRLFVYWNEKWVLLSKEASPYKWKIPTSHHFEIIRQSLIVGLTTQPLSYVDAKILLHTHNSSNIEQVVKEINDAKKL